jgi:hypothetical protein
MVLSLMRLHYGAQTLMNVGRTYVAAEAADVRTRTGRMCVIVNTVINLIRLQEFVQMWTSASGTYAEVMGADV